MRPDVVEYYERMLAKARCGEVQGALGAADLASGGQHIYTCGTLADDANLAVQIVAHGLDELRGRLGPGEKMSPGANSEDYIPAGLRNGWGTS